MTLEQMQEQFINFHGTDQVKDIPKALNSLITEVWNEAIKECEGCVPEMKKKNSIKHFSGNGYFNQQGFNQCRNQTLQAMRQLAYNRNTNTR